MPIFKITILSSAQFHSEHNSVTIYKEKNTAKGAYEHGMEIGMEIFPGGGDPTNPTVKCIMVEEQPAA